MIVRKYNCGFTFYEERVSTAFYYYQKDEWVQLANLRTSVSFRQSERFVMCLCVWKLQGPLGSSLDRQISVTGPDRPCGFPLSSGKCQVATQNREGTAHFLCSPPQQLTSEFTTKTQPSWYHQNFITELQLQTNCSRSHFCCIPQQSACHQLSTVASQSCNWGKDERSQSVNIQKCKFYAYSQLQQRYCLSLAIYFCFSL